MAGLNGSKTCGLSLLMLFMLFILFAAQVHAHEEDHSAVKANGGLTKSSLREHVINGRMTFSEDHEGSNSEHPSTCTCTCFPGAPPKGSKPPTSQNSPTGKKRSPPPAPYYSPTPVDNSPSPPPGSTQSPVNFDSPPPAPYSAVPTYGAPSPVVAAPETFQPPPPIY